MKTQRNLIGGIILKCVVDESKYFYMGIEGGDSKLNVRTFLASLIDAYRGRYVDQYNPMYSYKAVFLIDLLFIELIRILNIEELKKTKNFINGYFILLIDTPTNEYIERNIELCTTSNLYREMVKDELIPS